MKSLLQPLLAALSLPNPGNSEAWYLLGSASKRVWTLSALNK